ncbi:glycosyltransferase family 2 protein [Desulfobacterales bacterium HSG17]|nr:glycosyltransferase family 2 protein [Desulfobacterales bacterium HSG17]
MKPKIYILILNWNGWKDTLECLESVFRLKYDSFQVIVCDNASQDNSLERICAWAAGDETAKTEEHSPLAHMTRPPVNKPISFEFYNRHQAETLTETTDAPLILIQTGDNLGFAGGNNVGMRYILQMGDAEYVWLLNNDTVIDPMCLDHMLESVSIHEKPAICGSRVLFYYEPEIIQALGGAEYNKWTGLAKSIGLGIPADKKIKPKQYESRLSYIVGASWLLPVRYLRDIGLMEEAYFLYYEEIDWCIRGAEKYDLCYSDKALVYHKEGKSIGSSSDKRKTSLLSDFYLFRNKLVFTWKYYPEALISVYATTFLQALNRIRRGQWDKAALIFSIMLGKKKFENQSSARNNS